MKEEILHTKISIDVSVHLKDLFKIYCIKNGTSMRQEFINFMNSKVYGGKSK